MLNENLINLDYEKEKMFIYVTSMPNCIYELKNVTLEYNVLYVDLNYQINDDTYKESTVFIFKISDDVYLDIVKFNFINE